MNRIKGTFMRHMYKDGSPNKLLAQEATIFDGVFAVYKEGPYTNNWHVDHTPTGLVCTRVPRKKYAVAIVRALLAIPLGWQTTDRDKLTVRMDKVENCMGLYRKAIQVRAE